MLDAVIKGLFLGMFMAISVGPTLFAILKYSLNHSYKAGLSFVFGVSVSDFLYVTIANLAAHWLVQLQRFETPISISGALVLMLIGILGIFKKSNPQSPETEQKSISKKQYFNIWLTGFAINTFNPGVIITWLAAVTAISVNSSTTYRLLLFSTCLIIILGIDFLKVFLADSIRKKLNPKRIIYIQKFSALCLFTIGLSLLISSIF